MIRLFQQFVPKRKLLLIASEGALLMGAVLVGTSLPGLSTRSLADAGMGELIKGLLSAFTVAILCQVSLSYNDLYDWRVSQNRADLPNRLTHAAGFSFIALAVIVFFLPQLFYFPSLPDLRGQTWKLVLVLVLSFSLIYFWRIGFHWFFYKWGFGERILMLGTGTQARQLCSEIRDHPETGYEIVGFLGPSPPNGKTRDWEAPYLGTSDQLPDLALKDRVSRVIVALEDRRGSLPVEELLGCRLAGIRVEEREALYEKIHGKISLDSLRPSYLIFSSGFRKSRLDLGAKRSVDIVIATAGLLVGWPLMLIVAVAVKLNSRGPVLLGQRRVGLDGREFDLLKFRSMHAGAEERSGPVWALTTDDRITLVGRFIRATRLDELPQLWNILRGDMSFVGPRPERPFFVEQLRNELPYYMERLTVRPGLTGWAQIKYAYGASVADSRQKLQYDLYYIKNMSPLFDLSILLRTIKVILFGQGR
ncbi:MAG: TIGR03013 family XrtA/PEP-CTERM system glycosyltransferase [Planctomycetota bacterium]